MSGFRLLAISCLWVLLLTNASTGQAAHEYIDIRTPSLKKIPIAVPAFKPLSPNGSEEQVSKSGSNLLSETLDYASFFKILDRGAFLADPQQAAIMGPDIRFKNWTAIGAELLVTGGVMVTGDILEMELRLFDTFQEKLLVGKKYKGGANDWPAMIRRFCSEVVFQLTGSKGVFDSKIAFVSSGTGNKEIFLCDFDGRNVQQLTRTGNITLSPAWSSDGKSIAYTAYAKGKPDLHIRHLAEKRGEVLDMDGTNTSPAWVPGRFELTASLTYAGDPDIYLLTGNGKVIKRLTDSWGIDESPAWSPDGKKMAFVSNRSGNPQVYVMEAGSGRTTRLTYEGKYNSQPSWSPRGDRIAYAGSEDGHFNIYAIGVDGKNRVQLTSGAGDNESPSWSPDGSLIVFSSTREGASRLYVMTAFGTDQRRLLTLPGSQSEPSWSPNMNQE